MVDPRHIHSCATLSQARFWARTHAHSYIIFLVCRLFHRPKNSSGAGSGEGGSGDGDGDSELSIVSSSRYSGLVEGWWKKKAPMTETRAESTRISTAIVAVRTQSKGKRVHWE